MATANQRKRIAVSEPVRRTAMVLGATLLLLLAWFVWNFDHYRAQARLATAYGARIACSCHYVEGRPLESCNGDFDDGMGLVSLRDDSDTRSIRARIFLMASATAHYQPGFGCMLAGQADK